MRLKSIDVPKYIKKLGLEDICTGGGCYGWYYKKGSYTYYITTMSDLTLPTKYGEHISIGVYDSDFEKQYICYDIKRFVPSKTMTYINMLDRKMKTRSLRAELEKNPDRVLYLPKG
jgi:hypothetical protein